MTRTPKQIAADTARVLEWFMSDDTGISSKSIAAVMCGADARKFYLNFPPADPSDLGRCLRLLERFPGWKERMPEMAKANEYWARVVPHWDEVAASMADEVGIDWSKGKNAPRTFELMKNRGF
jgi:hypothetical protein